MLTQLIHVSLMPATALDRERTFKILHVMFNVLFSSIIIILHNNYNWPNSYIAGQIDRGR